MIKIKTGIGFDVHQFVKDRDLYLGGVKIPYEFGLKGHSDADVLIHAIIDAIVSPTLATDIGKLFPDTSEEFKNIDSKILLKKAVQMVVEKGFDINNIDSVIIAQEPKISPYIYKMREVLSDIIGIPIENITIKGTTTEYLGFTGRKEGIAAVAVATMIK
ncbi:2-C-methyl-D-erythritol 2,4-cyclodiphosphate synthase [Deferribacter desulfuricans SSM1]|uniref:2-C-methyl-D-erythritol 2,4-cyclodiphosphate synthase n=1 Tax=Deferribacter desulfuricans (strain DSM 14783 / JCM 11476 / NBRC 101012 / SSM1) TaxID=639282 RepID=D3P8R8_DEFDS|nr:2-C-methyl-D-erythritol 2,4-cyclodiphosphate synthase [Deferribacter desulfuricans]BAI81108.1 2-C-methyl-D-erythritol 2,4-cyclodiphosphate synthase [Deferribacter desulfuricans SSM1]